MKTSQGKWLEHCRGVSLLMIVFSKIISTAGCGAKIEIQLPSQVGIITSPGHPSDYPNGVMCIWYIIAPVDYAVQLSIPSFSGQTDTSGGCLDYLEVRNGSATESLEYKECSTGSPATIQSTSRWLWVKFKSDDTVTSTGFSATYSVVSSTGNAGDSSPEPACRSVSFRCPNRECISWAYVCDGVPDCGCSGSGCDEIGCGGINWANETKILVGFGTGLALFCLVFFAIGVIDVLLKRRAEKNYKRDSEKREKLAKQKRAQAAVESMFNDSHSKHDSISRQTSWCRTPGDKSPTTPTSLAPPRSPVSLKGK